MVHPHGTRKTIKRIKSRTKRVVPKSIKQVREKIKKKSFDRSKLKRVTNRLRRKRPTR